MPPTYSKALSWTQKGRKFPRRHWTERPSGFISPPSFTPKLVKFRDANKKNFEVVFVSSDRSPKAQLGYMKETGMKWYTMPHGSSAANALKKKYSVRGIPALIIVSSDGKTITTNGRGDVSSNAKGALKDWAKKSS